ncbi:MAG: hypothetical protein LBS07_00620 [Prevotellaceae bacterium]|jgi:hypothetical protein|nr:hypothetical protein [Prevotellaceae bacterium]
MNKTTIKIFILGISIAGFYGWYFFNLTLKDDSQRISEDVAYPVYRKYSPKASTVSKQTSVRSFKSSKNELNIAGNSLSAPLPSLSKAYGTSGTRAKARRTTAAVENWQNAETASGIFGAAHNPWQAEYAGNASSMLNAATAMTPAYRASRSGAVYNRLSTSLAVPLSSGKQLSGAPFQQTDFSGEDNFEEGASNDNDGGYVDVPVSGGMIPLLLFAGVYICFIRRKNKYPIYAELKQKLQLIKTKIYEHETIY